jgi:hypothetical protein
MIVKNSNGKDEQLRLAEIESEKVVDPERLELPTPAFEAQCSIQLSYGSDLLWDS